MQLLVYLLMHPTHHTIPVWWIVNYIPPKLVAYLGQEIKSTNIGGTFPPPFIKCTVVGCPAGTRPIRHSNMADALPLSSELCPVRIFNIVLFVGNNSIGDFLALELKAGYLVYSFHCDAYVYECICFLSYHTA